MSLDVVTLGETMVLLLAEQSGPMREAATFRRHIAGAESNVAIGLCRLGQTAGWFSRVGDDEFGRAVVFRIRGEGVDTSHVLQDPLAPTGMVVRERREAGPIDQVYYRRGSAASRMSPADLDADYLKNAQFVHLTGITPALSASCRETVFAAAEMANAAGVPVVLDPNYRSKLWDPVEARSVMRDLAGRSNLLLPGMEEAELLTGESDPEVAARQLSALGPATVVVKLGAQGALALAGDALVRVPGTPLERVVDPVGAGDAFAAGFLAGLLRGFSTDAALRLANRCGAFSMLSPGDMEALPRWEEVSSESSSSDVRR
jgi:2-dehydro-3-deoxygluconokinase